MIKIFYLFLICFPALLWTQTIDSSKILRIDSLVNLSSDYNDSGQFEQALEIIGIAEKLARDSIGPMSSIYGNCILGHARIFRSKEDFQSAEKYFSEAKVIFEQTVGNESSLYVNCLNGLAGVYLETAKYEQSELLYLDRKKICERTFGIESPEYAKSLSNLATLYYNVGKYKESELLLIETIALRAKILGKEDVDYARSLISLGILYWRIGRYDKAEPLYLEAMAINEKKLGKEDPDYASNLNNLAVLYYDMRLYEKAESLYLEAKAIHEKTHGKENTGYAASLNNLAVFYWNQNKYEKAEQYFLEVKSIKEKLLGNKHPDYASSLNNLAVLYRDIDQFDKAESLYLESIAILKKTVGPDHPDCIGAQSSLAILYGKSGQFAKAEPLMLEAQVREEKIWGVMNPEHARTLFNLAILYWYMKKYDKAEAYFNKLSTVNRELLERALHHLSDQELNQYLDKFVHIQNNILSFLYDSRNADVISTCFSNCLFYKGFLLNATLQIKRLANSNPEAQKKYSELKAVGQWLADEYSKPLNVQDSARLLKENERYNQIEKDLALKVSGYKNVSKQIDWKDVYNVLKPGEAALELIQYHYENEGESDSTFYAALILISGVPNSIFIHLFEERSLDSLLNVHNERKADYVNQLYSISDRGAQEINYPNKTLYKLIWQPIEKDLVGIKTIYYSSSGLLHRLNLGAIPVNPEETLADRYRLIRMNSTRQLAIPDFESKEGHDAVLFGGLNYEPDSQGQQYGDWTASRSMVISKESSLDSTMRGGSWNYLPGTEKEIRSIRLIMDNAGIKTILKSGNEGTEDSFKSLGNNSLSPKILHIATHGYFFLNEQMESDSVHSEDAKDEPVFKKSKHPMLRSGLILSGGNAGWKGERSLVSGEDGVLTAYEISQMNLSNTELVVLSACETGLGDIQGNEGVYGLQRAFKIAGVKYIIMSLWQVPDKQTSLLMTTFYKKWLEAEGPDKGGKKMSIPDAFHAAQKELRELGFDPYQWAGFVLIE